MGIFESLLIWAKICWFCGLNKEKHDLPKPENVPQTSPLLMRRPRDSSEGIRHGSPTPCGTQLGNGWAVTESRVGRGAGAKSPLAHHRTEHHASELCNYFALRPISTWEQCKLFKTRFSGLAIIIMMISISVAIASDYLAGNFAAWGRGSSREPTRIVRSEGVERGRKRRGERE